MPCTSSFHHTHPFTRTIKLSPACTHATRITLCLVDKLAEHGIITPRWRTCITGRLQNLRSLDLGKNELMSLPGSLGRGCAALRFLSVHDNPPLVGLPLSLSELLQLETFV